MLPPDARVDDANLGALAVVAEVVKLADARGVVHIVLAGGGVIAERLRLQGGEDDAVVDPDPGNVGQLLEAVEVVRVGDNAGAAENVRLKGLDNVDVDRRGEAITAHLGRALGASQSMR